MVGSDSGAQNVEDIRREMQRQRFRHLAVNLIAHANEEYLLTGSEKLSEEIHVIKTAACIRVGQVSECPELGPLGVCISQPFVLVPLYSSL
jgi:hypothetical protein